MTGPAPALFSPDNLYILLVQTQEPGNLGACARAMMNMGLGRLRLLNSCDPRHPQCRALAGKAYPIIEHAERFNAWEDAVSDLHILAASTSARERLLERPVLPVRQAGSDLFAKAASAKVGIVFGPERTGLTEWYLSRCQLLVSIPSHEAHPVLNLAQAVMIFCYEIFLAGFHRQQKHSVEGATQQQRQQMLLQAQELLTRIGFLNSSHPEHMMALVRNLLREDLSAREVRTVRGILSQTEWFIDSGRDLPPGLVKRK